MQDYKYLLERQIGEEITEEPKIKRKSSKRLYLILAIFLIILGSGIFFFLKSKNLKKIKVFSVKKIEIIGVENSSKDKILKILKKNQDRPLKEIYSKLIKIKWVDDVILRRKFPSILVVKIIEKKPESLLQLNGKLYLIDKDGEIIDKYQSKFYRRDFIIFQVPGIKNYTNTEKQKIATILEILKKYPFIEDISDITIQKDKLSIILTQPRLKLLISMDNLKDEIYKVGILKRLAATDYVKNAAVAKLDYKDRIYLSRSE